MPHLIVPGCSARHVGSAAHLLALLSLTLTATIVGPAAAAQTPAGPGCECDTGAGAGTAPGPATRTSTDTTTARGDDHNRTWWLTAFAIPFLGVPLGWGGLGQAPTMQAVRGGESPGVETPVAGSSGVGSAGVGSPRSESSERGPVIPLTAGPGRMYALVAPATATAQPAILLAGTVLSLLGMGLLYAQRRTAARAVARAVAAAQSAARPASATPRVLFAPASTALPRRRNGLGAFWLSPVAPGGLVVASVGCFALAGLGYMRGAVAAWEVRSNWAKSTAQAARVSPGGLEIAAVARLEIPAIGLTRLVGEGVDTRTLAGGPGHMPATVAPGLTGLSVISAHRDSDFRHLGALRLGDTVVTTTRAQRTVWRIVERAVVPSDSAALVPAASHARLALTTCWPIRYIGPAPERLLLFADSVHAEPAPPEPVRVAARS